MARKPKQTEKSSTEKESVKDASLIQEASLAEEIGEASYVAEYRSRCGGALRANREKLGLTTQDIANRLRLSNKQIEALEADNFSALPEATIVKGFIRNYAKILKVPVEPLLDAYNVIVPEQAPQSFTLQPSIGMKVGEYEKPNAMRYVLLALALLLGFGAWLFYQSYVQKPNPVKPSTELVAKAVEPLPEAALPAAERAPDNTTQLTLPPPVGSAQPPIVETPTAAVAETSPLAPQPPVSSVAVPTQQTNQVEQTNQAVGIERQLSAPPPEQAASNGTSKLEFNATQETWISVTDATGKEVYNRILFAGNREVVQAKAPMNITVGNALGTTLSVNGRAIELAPHTRTNVAHVKVD